MKYVIHEHQKHGDPVHWDLMLECGAVLKTFRLDWAPHALLTHPCLVIPIFDHDTRFLTYEGPVQQGLGQVKRVDWGTYDMVSKSESTWIVDLQGEKLQTRLQLPLEQPAQLIILKISGNL